MKRNMIISITMQTNLLYKFFVIKLLQTQRFRFNIFVRFFPQEVLYKKSLFYSKHDC
jgi:hypothetical protein